MNPLKWVSLTINLDATADYKTSEGNPVATIDASTTLGKCRLRCGDYSDLPLLPDSVYLSTLYENNGNVPRSSMICATYILSMLAMGCHQKMSYLEVFGNQKYEQYESYLLKIAKDPMFSGSSPIPYTGSVTDKNQLIQFTEDWNKSYVGYTESQELHNIAESDPL